MIKNALKDLHLKLKPKGGGSRGENYIIQLSLLLLGDFWGLSKLFLYILYSRP